MISGLINSCPAGTGGSSMKSDNIFPYVEKLDQYGFDDVKHLLSCIESFFHQNDPEENTDGLLIAIKGDWGSGKTSVLRMLETYFRDFRECNTVFFEAWKYHHESNPLLPLIHQMGTSLSSQALKNFAKKSFSKYSGDIGEFILKSGLRLAGIDDKNYNDIKRHVGNLIKVAREVSHKELAEFDKQFDRIRKISSELAEKRPKTIDEDNQERWRRFMDSPAPIKRQLFVLVDDLDRLLPDDAVRLFEAIRFYLKIPRTVVIMGVNDRVLSGHILDHFRLSIEEAEQDEFLEKLFDFSFELNPLPFDTGYMTLFHFHTLNDRAKVQVTSFFDEIKLDSLTHRKWKRLANRFESERVVPDALDRNRARVACLKELFPKTERFIRGFEQILEPMAEGKLDAVDDHIKERLLKTLEQDRAFFHFPKINFDRLFQPEERPDETL